jgi:dolichol-phosphate mannosyltransferase
VGSTGYAVNLAVYWFLVTSGFAFVAAAVCSFLAAVANNYALNRALTFRHQRAGVLEQGARYLAVSLLALLANVAVLVVLVHAGLENVPAQAVAIVLVTPVSFLGNKLWSFGR